ncbi:MAG TPA: hypothetical protein VN808_13855 [Stellaceae bacterium]|nr:hypothetical protein [Stellaceae bacterium]
MGLGADTLDMLERLHAEGRLTVPRSVMEIGAQQLSNNFLEAKDRIDRVGKIFKIPTTCPLPDPTPTYIVHGDLEHLAEDAPRARDFWTWLGFDYAAVDFDGSPGSIPLDLNFDPAPAPHVGKHQLVTNFGTTEHVANQLNAFKVIHDFAAVDGLMVHAVPMQGMLNHGLVNYTPKFFWMLARSNGYRFIYMNLGCGEVSYAFPDNVADAIRPFDAAIETRRGALPQLDAVLIVVLQKVFDITFVPPIDVPTGTRTDNAAMKERYWTVFKPHAFARVPQPLSRRFAHVLARLKSSFMRK